VEIFCAPIQLKKVVLIHAKTVKTYVFCRKCCSLGLANCCWTPDCITEKVLAHTTSNLRIMWVGMDNIIVNFHCNQMSTKTLLCVTIQLRTNFFEKVLQPRPRRWFSTKHYNSKRFWSICIKFSGIMCQVIKNIRGKFCCKQTSMQKAIALAFIYVNLHLVYSIEWRICVNQHRRC